VRVFLDTNVLFSSAYRTIGAPAHVVDLAGAGAFVPVISTAVVRELAQSLQRKAPRAIERADRILAEVRFELAGEAAGSAIERWRNATLGTDAPIIAAALAAEVDYFCTGDRRILARGRAGELAGLRVASPAELVEILESAPA